ncbi:MAG: hypothetical protein OEZ39_18490 [Gammaproteobacteria bacterium]|nr:hypothetical protein [Gammaproteobacteria bacterium]MDH5653857.1 hypothetical protein [Gammaproteobacteria bacterium]
MSKPGVTLRGFEYPGQQVFRGGSSSLCVVTDLQFFQQTFGFTGGNQCLMGIMCDHPLRTRAVFGVAFITCARGKLISPVPDSMSGIGEGIPLHADECGRGHMLKTGKCRSPLSRRAFHTGLEIAGHLGGFFGRFQLGLGDHLTITHGAGLDL